MVFNAQNENTLPVGIGQETEFSGKSVTKVKFAEVLEDSRCPEGVDCLWAGNARIALELYFNDKEPLKIEMDTNGPKSTVEFEGGAITIVSLDPYPKADTQIDRSAYKVSLQIKETDQ